MDLCSLIQEKDDQIHRLEISLEEVKKKLSWYEEQYRLWRQTKFGKSSESLSGLQVELIFNADEALELKPEKELTPEEKETLTYTRAKRKNGRNIDTSTLPRQQVVHDLSEAEKHCKTCSHPLHKIREDVSEQIELIPKQLYVIEHVHPQYACRQCKTVVSAEKTLAPLPKCMAGPSLIADVVVSKYDHHLPLYRQSRIFKSLQLDLPDNTLGNWVMECGEALSPLDQALASEILHATYLQVDETPVKLLEPEKKAFMWCYLSPAPNHRLIRFRFDLTRGKAVVGADLARYQGLLQTDAYSGYRETREKSGVIALGCMVHARRKFVDVVKIASAKSLGKAHTALDYFKRLYALEENYRQEQLDFEERKKRRRREAVPILDEFHDWLLSTQGQVPPGSKIGEALEYTLKQWPYLIEYTQHGEAEIDNNGVENQIRPFALGRRNWLFVGTERSAQIAALYYSLIQSAKLNHLNPRAYIHYLLTQVHALRKKEIDPQALLPHRLDAAKLQAFAAAEYEKTKHLFAHFALISP